MYHDPNFCEVIQVDLSKAIDYWNIAFNNSMYNHPEFLSALCENTHWWLGIRKGKPLILWPVCLNNDNKPFLLNDLFFIGPIWLYDTTKMPSYKWVNHYRELSQLFISTFIDKYNGFCFDLPFGMMDVRPFTSHNLLLPPNMNVDIQVRYTSRICGLDTRSYDDVLNCMKLDRRQKIRQFERKSTLQLSDEYNELEVLSMYRLFVESKNFPDVELKVLNFQKILKLVRRFDGKIIMFRDNESKMPIACSILFLHKGVCNLMYQIYSPHFRQSGGPPWVMNELIKYSISLKCSIFDFNGGNHLDLAHDKHSYGADAFPYIRVVSSN